MPLWPFTRDIKEVQALVRPPTTLCSRMGSYSDLRWGLSGTLRRYRTTTFLKAGSWISRGLNRFSNTFAASGMMLRSERLTTVCAQTVLSGEKPVPCVQINEDLELKSL